MSKHIWIIQKCSFIYKFQNKEISEKIYSGIGYKKIFIKCFLKFIEII